MGKSKIEWTDAVWNPVTGCTPISPGCENCYAKRMASRLRGRCGYPADDPFQVTLHPKRLEEPLRWKRPRKVFVCSMGDLFHEDVPDSFIDQVFAVMAVAQQHTFQVLTKRPERMLQWFTHTPSGATRETLVYEATKRSKWPGWPLPNVWVGVSCENQAAADERIPILLQIPAAVRFVSVEPMLGAVDLMDICFDRWTRMNVLAGSGVTTRGLVPQSIPNVFCERIDWVIVGGETGPNARPCHPDWVRSLRDQCQDAGTPFFFKQWGEWTAEYPQGMSLKNVKMTYCHGTTFYRIGKKLAGRMLDGKEWNEFPEGKVKT